MFRYSFSISAFYETLHSDQLIFNDQISWSNPFHEDSSNQHLRFTTWVLFCVVVFIACLSLFSSYMKRIYHLVTQVRPKNLTSRKRVYLCLQMIQFHQDLCCRNQLHLRSFDNIFRASIIWNLWIYHSCYKLAMISPGPKFIPACSYL